MGSGNYFQLQPLERRTLLASPATGIHATYYDDLNFSGVSVQRVDRAVDFNWGNGSPAAGIGVDAFSVRWTARLKAATSENYRIYLLSESPVRVWLRNQLIVDAWKSSSQPANFKGSIPLTANTRYDLQVELGHGTGPASVKLMWQTDTLIKQTIPNRLMSPLPASVQSRVNHTLAFARDRVTQTLTNLPSPSSGFPEQTRSDGTWVLQPASAWTSGYFGGVMWELDKHFASGWDSRATTWSTPLASQSAQPGDHFARLWTTFKPLYDKTRNTTYRQVLIDAADSKNAQFSTKIGAFRTPDLPSNSGNPSANFGLLMDQTLDLELMFWASDQTGNRVYRDRAVKHLETMIARMIRADGSVFQRFFFDGATGQAIGGENYQGHSNASTWSRGQAWAVYGISAIAERSGRADFLAAARKVADYFITHLPPDSVPYWDFDAPGIPATYRDSSAAAIAARGFVRLWKITGKATYRASAEKILDSLMSPQYLADGTSSRGVLRHAALNVPKNRGVDTSLIFADYYLLESISAYMS